MPDRLDERRGACVRRRAGRVEPFVDDWRARLEAESSTLARGGGKDAPRSSGWAATLEAAPTGASSCSSTRRGTEGGVSVPRVRAGGRRPDTCPLDGTTLERHDDGLDLAVHLTLAYGGDLLAVDRQDLDPSRGSARFCASGGRVTRGAARRAGSSGASRTPALVCSGSTGGSCRRSRAPRTGEPHEPAALEGATVSLNAPTAPLRLFDLRQVAADDREPLVELATELVDLAGAPPRLLLPAVGDRAQQRDERRRRGEVDARGGRRPRQGGSCSWAARKKVSSGRNMTTKSGSGAELPPVRLRAELADARGPGARGLEVSRALVLVRRLAGVEVGGQWGLGVDDDVFAAGQPHDDVGAERVRRSRVAACSSKSQYGASLPPRRPLAAASRPSVRARGASAEQSRAMQFARSTARAARAGLLRARGRGQRLHWP